MVLNFYEQQNILTNVLNIAEKIVKEEQQSTYSSIEFSNSTISEESDLIINFEAKTEEAKNIIFQQIFTILKINPHRRRRKQL